MIKLQAVIAGIVVGALLVAVGCGSGEGGSYGSRGEPASAGEETSGGRYAESGSIAGVVSVARVGDLGKVLVDSKGLTLYYFEKDRNGRSACYGACAEVWPPLRTSGSPHASGGAQASKLAATRRTDGTVQVTYAGWPLYTYAADNKPGEDNGTDVDSFGAAWYPLHPNGKKAGD